MTSQLQIDAIRSVASKLPNSSLGPARDAALAELARNGLPNLRHEDWKYTDLKPVIDISNQWLAAGAQSASVAAEHITGITAGAEVDWLVICNGVVTAESLAALQRPGLALRLLSEQAAIPAIDMPLADFNSALLKDGLELSVTTDYDNEKPIGLLHIDRADTAVGSSHTRILINVADNSAARFIEHHTSGGEAAHYANSIIDVSLGAGARVDYLRYQDRNEQHSQTAFLRATLRAGSQFHHGAFDFGGRLIRNDLNIQINGPDALASFCGLYLANERQHIDNHTRVDHRVGPARSEQEYRGILADQARCVWNGKAVVHIGADGTDANQANHNLLLSDRSEIDAKPELEIYADDVKCSHGTTVGQLDDAALFYLQTRGIDAAVARQLLTVAFTQKIVDMSPINAYHDVIAGRLADKIATLVAGDFA